MENKQFPTIRELYPHLSDAELLVAEDNLERYLTLMLRIFERIEAGPGLDSLTHEEGMVGYISEDEPPQS